MRKFSQKITASVLFLLLQTSLFAQNTSAFEKSLVSTNKMIAVVLVLVVILLGVAAYLFYLDKRLNELEKDIKTK